MIKRKVKKIFILLLVSVILPNYVYAAKAWVSQNGDRDTNIQYDNGNFYADYHITVRHEGSNYEAYCIDFGATMHGGNDPMDVTCQEIASPALAYVLSDPNASHKVKQLASRTIAQQMGINKTSHTVVSQGGETLNAVNQLLANANSYENYVNGVSASSGSITFMRTGGNENTVTYNLYSSTRLNNVEFTCQNCSITSQSWNGTSGTITVSATTPNCEFQIIATYDSTGLNPDNENNNNNNNNNGNNFGDMLAQAGNTTVVFCSGEGSTQGTVFTVNGSFSGSSTGNSGNSGNSGNFGGASGSGAGSSGGGSSSSVTIIDGGRFKQTYSDRINAATGGNYYREYCEEPDDDSNLCECTEQTTVNMPGLCDVGTNNASIKAPGDVQCCILNGKDEAGNTYEMLDGQIDNENPYCAVYCKEDYEMTLPGAKYTESGRYFELENTVVSAKRTCYATNPKKDSDEQQILIDEFVEDVNTLQQQLVEAFNNWKKWQAISESASTIPNESNTSTTTTCASGTEITTIVSKGPNVNYNHYNIQRDEENSLNGRWKVTGTTQSTVHYEYSIYPTCENPNPDPVVGDNGMQTNADGTESVCDSSCVSNKVDV